VFLLSRPAASSHSKLVPRTQRSTSLPVFAISYALLELCFHNIILFQDISRSDPSTMNGALGGAVPASVSPSELYDVISAAASQDPSRIQASTQRLKEMLQLSGSYDALHEIAAQKSLPLQVRQQSIIQFKNVALIHWRSRKSAPCLTH
jgi:Importin-beta N-terminal domain